MLVNIDKHIQYNFECSTSGSTYSVFANRCQLQSTLYDVCVLVLMWQCAKMAENVPDNSDHLKAAGKVPKYALGAPLNDGDTLPSD